jgi:hypothetical protein
LWMHTSETTGRIDDVLEIEYCHSTSADGMPDPTFKRTYDERVAH